MRLNIKINPQGYSKNENSTCVDVDECNLSIDNCDPNANCANLAGSFKCTCLIGWEGDGVTCYDVDECNPNVNRNHTCTTTELCHNLDGGFQVQTKIAYP